MSGGKRERRRRRKSIKTKMKNKNITEKMRMVTCQENEEGMGEGKQ